MVKGRILIGGSLFTLIFVCAVAFLLGGGFDRLSHSPREASEVTIITIYDDYLYTEGLTTD